MTIARCLRLGVVGLSEGNGHPYSWSAIINGYDPAAMAECPFPVIPAYLGERRFPEEQLRGARVTHIWTQDDAASAHIARAARIPSVVQDFHEMVGEVDALLLARDDAEHHLGFAAPFLEAGIPVYLDKPPALSVRELDALFALAVSPEQIFSCSPLRFSEELRLTGEESERLGPIRHVTGVTPKSWDRYAAHVIDPIVSFIRPGKVADAKFATDGKSVALSLRWESGCSGVIQATGEASGEIVLTYFGERTSVQKVFRDSFAAFRSALRAFIDGVLTGRSETSYEHLCNVVQVIEMGMRARVGPANCTAHESESIGRSC